MPKLMAFPTKKVYFPRLAVVFMVTLAVRTATPKTRPPFDGTEFDELVGELATSILD
jgi:hypothetical protein